MKNASVSTAVVEQVAPGQMQEINAAILRGTTGFLARLRHNDAQRFVGSPGLVTDVVAQALASLLPKRMTLPHKEVEWWQKYYHDTFGIKHSFEGLDVPAEAEYKTRLTVMHTDVSARPQRIATAYKSRCKNDWWQYAEDLDAAVPTHIRTGTYAIRVADVEEAPDGFENDKNLSSQDVLDRGWTTTTLPERLIDGDTHLLKRKEHLDRKVVTLCPGSRTSDGCVPSVYLNGDGKVSVNDWSLHYANDSLRFRRAIV